MKELKYIFYFAILVFTNACIEPFDFTVESTENVLVVEGGITNLAKAHEIKLSYSYELGANDGATLSDAKLTILSESGGVEILSATGEGVYVTSETYAGEVGERYKLIIETGESRYESSYEELVAAPEIDSVYGRYVELPNEETNEVEGGIQFFVDTGDPSLNSSYYRFEWEDAYEIRVPYPSFYEVINGEVVLRTEEVGKCYDYDTSSSLIIGTAIGSFENQLREFPFRFISENEQKIRTRVGILTRQYAVSENAYTYYRKLRENSDATGSLFDIQAGTVVGNMTATTNQDEIVLGFFEVAGVSERRDFFIPQQYSLEGLTPPEFLYPSCDMGELFDFESAALEVLANEPFLQLGGLFVSLDPTGEDMVYVLHRNCSRCDWYADTTPPEFWIE